jgi:tripartite-type tricarboxylate transporter receptor subunit TctC
MHAAVMLGGRMLRCLAPLAALVLAGLPQAQAQDSVAQFYRGRQVTIVVGSPPGGGFDIYARLVGRHIGKYIPGNPNVIVSNMPGAASNASLAHIYNVAPRDGTVIGAPQNSAITDALFDLQLGNARKLRHDATKLIQIGSATTDHYVCIGRADGPIKTFKDALTQEFLIGASQPGTSTRDYPAMLNHTTGSKIRQVSGYPGTREITLAIEKNEVQGLCGFPWSSLNAQRPDWISSGFIRVVVQEHDKGNPEINKMGVPLAVDFATSPENRKIMELVYSSETFGRPYVTAPEVPADRVAALRKAFMEAMKDEELLAEAKRIRLAIDPISGEELQELAGKIFGTPRDLVEKTKQAMEYKAP